MFVKPKPKDGRLSWQSKSIKLHTPTRGVSPRNGSRAARIASSGHAPLGGAAAPGVMAGGGVGTGYVGEAVLLTPSGPP